MSSAICQNILNPGYKETKVIIGRLQAGVWGGGGGGGEDSVAVCREMTSYYVNCVSPLKCPLCFVSILTVYRVSFETRGSLTIVVSFPLVVKMFLLLKFRERLTGQSSSG